MHEIKDIDYYRAQNFFNEAEIDGQKLIIGNLEANIWLHKEAINLDFVIETAKKFSDSRIFIISKGINKGFYIYSTLKKSCIKLIPALCNIA